MHVVSACGEPYHKEVVETRMVKIGGGGYRIFTVEKWYFNLTGVGGLIDVVTFRGDLVYSLGSARK